jgi:hypothetical protein
MESRRSVFKKLFVGAVATIPVGLALRASNASLNESPKVVDPAPPQHTEEVPWGLVSPLAAGSEIGAGWSIGSMSPIIEGAIQLTLTHATGRSMKVRICKRGESPVGIAQTETLDLIAMNGGDGHLPTEESFGLAVLAVADVLRRNEAVSSRVLTRGLVTHEEHLKRLEILRGGDSV